MIPKIIHYIWFGPNPFPKLVKKSIESWKKYLPDYEFKLWNENTFDINISQFTKQAYENKKWAFVSDYVRIWALKEYGGIYLDTDIEVLKSFSESILAHKAVLGTDDGGYLTALMMAEPYHPFFQEALAKYDQMQFINKDGKLQMEVNNTHLQDILKSYGYEVKNDFQELKDGIIVFPDDFFHVRSLTSGKLNLTNHSFTIHWHTITWVPRRTKIINFIRIKILVPLLGIKVYTNISSKFKRGKTYV